MKAYALRAEFQYESSPHWCQHPQVSHCSNNCHHVSVRTGLPFLTGGAAHKEASRSEQDHEPQVVSVCGGIIVHNQLLRGMKAVQLLERYC